MDPQVNPFAVLSLIVAPAVLTNASPVLAMSTSTRLARAVDRARELSRQLEEAGALAAPEAGRRLRELRVTEQRSLLLLVALRSFYVALSSFASATLVSLLGAGLAPAPPSRYKGLISTLRNFTTPLSLTTLAPYCSAIRPLPNLVSCTPSTVLCPLRVTVKVGPWAVIS